MTRSCARRSLAAETTLFRSVICCVFLTERMRRRMSIRLGMRRFRGFLIGHEPRLEFFHRSLEFAAQLIVQRLLGANFVPQSAVGVFDEARSEEHTSELQSLR